MYFIRIQSNQVNSSNIKLYNRFRWIVKQYQAAHFTNKNHESFKIVNKIGITKAMYFDQGSELKTIQFKTCWINIINFKTCWINTTLEYICIKSSSVVRAIHNSYIIWDVMDVP